MIPQTIIQLSNEYKDLVSKAQETVSKFLTNKSIPLEDRWETYLVTPAAFLFKQEWVEHFDSLESVGFDCWYSDFYVERYSTVILADIVTQIEENVGDVADVQEDTRFNRIDLNAFKEEILQKCIYSFTYDW